MSRMKPGDQKEQKLGNEGEGKAGGGAQGPVCTRLKASG